MKTRFQNLFIFQMQLVPLQYGGAGGRRGRLRGASHGFVHRGGDPLLPAEPGAARWGLYKLNAVDP